MEDRCLHGTHIAGVIAGSGEASAGTYRGIAPGATLLVLKIAAKRMGFALDAAAAVEAAIEAGANIINYSHGILPRNGGAPPWVWPEKRSPLEEMMEAAAEKGILCCVAAGNEGGSPSSVTSPGGLECALTVGAITHDAQVRPSSGRGPFLRSDTLRAGGATRYDAPIHKGVRTIRKPDIVLFGEGITAPRTRHVPPDSSLDDDVESVPEPTTSDPAYVTLSGTSQATAVASGLAACLLELARVNGIDLGPNEGRTILALFRRAAGPLQEGDATDWGAGLVNWPLVLNTLQDFATDPAFRELVLNPEPGLHLL